MITYKRYELVAPDGYGVGGKYKNLYNGVEWSDFDMACDKFKRIRAELLSNRRFVCLQLREIEYEALDDGDDVVIEDRLIAEIDTSRLPMGGYITEIN